MRRSNILLAVALLTLVAAWRFAAAEEAAVFLNDSPARRAIEKRLAEPIDLRLDNAPLSDVVEFLRDSTRLDLQLDTKALEEAGVASDTPISLQVKGISLRSALNLMLRGMEMTWTVRDDALVLSTQSQAETMLETAIYPVADLIYLPATSEAQRVRQSPDFNTLIEVICAIVAPTSWGDVGGAGVIQFDRRTNSLVVSQTIAIHEEIVALLADLRAARDQQFFPDRPRADKPSLDKIARERIERTLSAEVTLDMDQIPLVEAMQKVAADSKLAIVIDRKSLDEAGVATDIAVRLRVKNVPLRQALRRLLDPVELEYVVRDEVLVITTDSQAETIQPIRVLPLFDLARSSGGSRPDYAPVSELIVRTLAPNTWSEVGGAGAIKAFPAAGALVIQQTEKIQEEIAAFVGALRNVQREEQAVAAAPADEKRPAQEAAAADELILVVHRLPMHLSDSYSGGMGGGMGGMFQVPAENQQPAAPAKPEAKPAESPAPRPTHPADIMAARQAARANAARDLERIIPQVISPESWLSSGGKGSIHAFGDKLIVRQTQSIHDQIDELLGEL